MNVFVEEPYIAANWDETLRFKESSNQRILGLKKANAFTSINHTSISGSEPIGTRT